MKQLSLALNVLLVALLILLCLKYCKKDPCSKYPQPKPTCGINSGDGYDLASSQITISTATMIYNLYNDDPSKAWIGGRVQQDSNYLDAFMLDIPMVQMKSFIAYVESKLCESQCADEMKLAIRAHYAKYPENVGTSGGPEDLRIVPEKFKNKHTLFFMPAFWSDEKGKYIVFDPDFVTDPCNIPVDLTSPGADRHAYLFGADGEDASNHGGLHPPPYDTASLTFPQR